MQGVGGAPTWQRCGPRGAQQGCGGEGGTHLGAPPSPPQSPAPALPPPHAATSVGCPFFYWGGGWGRATRRHRIAVSPPTPCTTPPRPHHPLPKRVAAHPPPITPKNKKYPWARTFAAPRRLRRRCRCKVAARPPPPQAPCAPPPPLPPPPPASAKQPRPCPCAASPSLLRLLLLRHGRPTHGPEHACTEPGAGAGAGGAGVRGGDREGGGGPSTRAAAVHMRVRAAHVRAGAPARVRGRATHACAGAPGAPPAQVSARTAPPSLSFPSLPTHPLFLFFFF